MAESNSDTHARHAYVSNPFLNGVRGLIDVLRYNPVSAMLVGLVAIAGIIAVAILVSLIASTLFEDSDMGIVGGIVFLLLYLAVITYVGGAYLAVAASSSRGHTVTTSKAFEESGKRFVPLFILMLLSVIGTVIGFILLVIPGLIFIARFSLAGLVMFEENLSPIDALKRSFQLTEGHTFEMIGAVFGGALLSGGGLLGPATAVAPLVGRYQDLRALKANKGQKPDVHWLNYLVTALVVFVALLYAFAIVSAIRTKDKIDTINNDFEKSLQEYQDDYEEELRKSQEEFDSLYNSDPDVDYDYDYNRTPPQ